MVEQFSQGMSILGLDIGTINTRAFLFDVVEDNYRLIASAIAPSTHVEPFFDVGDGAFESISKLQEITGRKIFDPAANLIFSSQPGGEGIDRFVITTSCSPELNLVVFGLLNEVSLDSVQKLANSTYAKMVEVIGINDRRPQNVQMDAVIASNPDLILFAGGTNNGASRSLLRSAELISNILQIIPRGRRPQVLYCGNPALSDTLVRTLDRYTDVSTAPNIRPSLEEEILEPAMNKINSIVMEKVYEKIGGIKRIANFSSIPPRLSNQAFYRVIRFLGQQYDPAKGVLGLDIGGSSTVVAYSNDHTSTLNTFAYGLGYGLEAVLQRSSLRDISKWLSVDLSDDVMRDYLWQHSVYPQTIATTKNELSIELAATRQLLRLVIRDLAVRNALPSSRFEPILVSGSTLNRTATPVQSLLAILDGIQPMGISPVIVDKHGILPMLGAIAEFNPLVAVQVLESTAFTNLATVVNIASRIRRGSTILTARLEYTDGSFNEIDVKQGSIVALPLPSGDKGLLNIRMHHRGEIEDIDISGEAVQVAGGVCGLVMDARGRPIKLLENDAARRKQLQDWEFLLSSK